jgi:dehydrogenase/reductase SDR family member 12
LIHNGGALLNQRSENAEGVELTLATHVVAPAILTTEALPALRRSRGRIITMSSGGMYSQKLDLDDLQNERDYQGAAAYARAKRMQIVLTMEWAQRFGPDVIAHAMHPGWADTPGVAHALPAFKKLVGPLLRTPEEGADTLVWLAGVDRDEIGTGGFWLDRRRRPLDYRPGTVVSEDEAQRLWCQIQDLAGFNCGDEPS